MAAYTPHQLAIPAPHDASFVDGEFALSISDPLDGTLGDSTYYLARMLHLPPGLYTFKSIASEASSWWIGERMAFAQVATDGVAEWNVYSNGQPFRLLVILENISPGGASIESYAALSIRSDEGLLVYSSTAAGWVADNAMLPDYSIPPLGDLRRTLKVFPFTPNWKSGVTERLSWLAGLMSSETATEQRRALRMHPLRSFEAAFLRAHSQRSRIDTFLSSVGQAMFLMPLWHDQLKLPVIIDYTDTELVFDDDALAFREFYAGDLVLLTNGDPDEFEVLEIDSVDLLTDTIALVEPPEGTWPAGSRLMPLRRAQFSESLTVALPSERVGQVQLRFDLVDPETHIVPSWGGDVPVWKWKPNRAERLTSSYSRAVFSVSNDIGTPYTVDPGDRSMIAMRQSLTLYGREQLSEFRAFLAAANGRTARFYVPSFTHDLEPVGAITGLTLDIRPIGFTEYMDRRQPARTIIAIELKDGSPTLYRTILTVIPVLSAEAPFRTVAETFELDEALPTLDRSDIARIMFVAPSRFDQDGFELHHATDGCKVVTASVQTVSYNAIDMAEISDAV